MEDICIGRKMTTITTVITVTNAQTQPIKARAGRIRITFFPANGGRYTFSTDSISAVDNGPTISAGDGPFEFSVDKHGNGVERAINVIGSAATFPAGIIETILGDKCDDARGS